MSSDFETVIGTEGKEAGLGFFAKFLSWSFLDGLTATPSGSQSTSLKLDSMFCRISTVATTADGVLLPVARGAANIGGGALVMLLYNDASNSMQVFAQGSDTIDGTAGATGVAHAGKTMAFYVCVTAGKWVRSDIGNGTMATQNANAVAITGGTIAGATITTSTFSGTTVSGTAVSGTSVTSSGSMTSSSPTAGVGYSTGSGGTVTQGTSKATGVTLNTLTGQITLNNSSLTTTTEASFTVTNSAVLATDNILLTLASGAATDGTYNYWVSKITTGASFDITVKNISAGTLSEALVINYAIIRGSAN